MKIECQSCFTDVIPMADGKCPACNTLLEGKSGAMTKVTIFQGGASGRVCMKCGAHTSNTVRVRRAARNANYKPAAVSSLEAHPLAFFLNFVAGKYRHAVEVMVPLCPNCRKNGTAEPKYIDFEARSMTFVGHRNWRDDVEREGRESKNV